MLNLADDQRSAAMMACLDQIIDLPDCVLSYDRDLISSLPDILAENYQITDDAAIARLKPLEEVCRLLAAADGSCPRIPELPALLKAANLSLDKYSTRADVSKVSIAAKEFDQWSEVSANVSLTSVIALQKDLGMGTHRIDSGRYDPRLTLGRLRNYLGGVSTPRPSFIERLTRRSFWHLKLKSWLVMGRLSRDRPSLSVGPRWVTEIEFFREVVGLRQHIGLDLFSDDSDLVIKGDMHQIPFDNNHFQFVFLKNVVDKSYDVRKLVRELIRVVRPGGIVVVDQVCGYGSTTPLTRTDIQKAANLARIFERYCKLERLVCRDIDISGLGDAKARNETRNNARLALRLKAG